MLIVAWETTAACNLACGYCRASATQQPDGQELSTGEAEAFLESIAPLQPMLILSGGEPLLRPDIFLLARSGAALGMRVSLASNGTFITPDIAERIRQSGITRVSISLDGAGAKRHDASRGPGSFDAAMRGVRSLCSRVPFQINFTITRRNESDVAAIFDLAERGGGGSPASFSSWWPPAVGGRRIRSLPKGRRSCSMRSTGCARGGVWRCMLPAPPSTPASLHRAEAAVREAASPAGVLSSSPAEGRSIPAAISHPSGKHQGKELYRYLGELTSAASPAGEGFKRQVRQMQLHCHLRRMPGAGICGHRRLSGAGPIMHPGGVADRYG